MIAGGSVKAGERIYKFNVLLTCDMKALAPFLGMYNTFHPKSGYKCMWCVVTNVELGDFTKKEWPFRKEEDILKAGRRDFIHSRQRVKTWPPFIFATSTEVSFDICLAEGLLC